MRPFYMSAAAERLFAVLWPASDAIQAGRCDAVLFLPPLGEEMNKCRPMMAAQARAFAQHGMHALIVDLFGTGDSDGEFGDATWQRWQQDLLLAHAWLKSELHVAAIHLLAVRSGALFASHLLGEGAAHGVQLALWQPVLNGADYWRQQTRMRMLADSTRGTPTTAADLQRQLESTGSLEIGGYTSNAMLVTSMCGASVDVTTLAAARSVLWAEVASAHPPVLSPATNRTLAKWEQQGVKVATQAVAGELFWSTPEIGFAHGLIDATSQFMKACRDR